MRESKRDYLLRMHQECLRDFDQIQEAMEPERRQCLEDRRFYSIAGAQWEGAIGEQFANKPKIEVNKVHLSVIRIINEYRNNRISVEFLSKDGSDKQELSDACAALYRADEQDSGAEEAYDNAFEEAVGGGFGAFRLRNVYEDESDEENEQQRIRIEPIFDADSCVFFDLDAKRQDKADATRCFVLTAMTPDAYRDEWDDEPSSWDKDIQSAEFDWATPDTVYVAEVYQIEQATDTIHIWSDLQGNETKYRSEDFENDEDLEERLIATGSREVRTRKIKRPRCRKLIMSGGGVLEDCGYIAGKYIPVVPVYGKRWFVDNVERCMGHVRLAKDAQRLANMQRSKLAELSAQSSIEKPIFSPEQISGHQYMWAEDTIKDYPYLLINPVTDAAGNQLPSGPIGYTKPPQVAPALAALLQVTEQDIQDVLGKSTAGEQIESNISGKAIELIQTRLDAQSYIYIDNLAKAIKRCGEVWLEMAKEVYVEPGRKMKGINQQGAMDSIELMQPMIGDNGEAYDSNDLSQAKFDVAVEVGPTSGSKRQATVRALTGMLTLTTDPETQQVLTSMAMLNMEGEGIGDVRDYFRKRMLRMGVVKPTAQEEQELAEEAANQKPDPNAAYLEAAAKEAEANAEKRHAETLRTLAQAEETQAKTAETQAKTLETLSGLGQEEIDEGMAQIDQIAPPGESGPTPGMTIIEEPDEGI